MKDLDNERNKINSIDKKMAELFVERMKTIENIAKIKEDLGLDVFDSSREYEVIQNNLKLIKDENLKNLYKEFLNNEMTLSKKYQSDLLGDLTVYTPTKTYDVIIEDNSLDNIEKYIDLNSKVLIVTDETVSKYYLEKIVNKCMNPYTYIITSGEQSKNFNNFLGMLNMLTVNEFTKDDKVISLGGGVVGDLAGFASSSYLRGIPFYNIPTTLLAQVDSSIGGKTAIDFLDIKNVIGSFYQPNRVVIDPTVLLTLDKRQLNSGLVEAIKMAITCDKDLFELIKNSENLMDDIKKIIKRSLIIKKKIVEMDTMDQGIRKVLNFGHTIGHAIEADSNYTLLHGECVGIGMMYFLDENIKEEVRKVLEKYNLPTKLDFNKDKIIELIKHDKKRNKDSITVVKVLEIGKYELVDMKLDEIEELIKG